MNLNTSRDLSRVYDALIVALATVGVLVTISSFRAGGAWIVVSVLFGIGVLLVLYGVFIEPRHLSVARYREKLVHHPGAWLRIVFLSDLHAGLFRPRAWYERIAIEAQALDPDILFLGGDFVEDEAAPIHELKPLARITAHLGRYFVLGNHDFVEEPALIRRTLREWGLTDLTNSHVTLRKEGHVMQLSALDDHWYGHPLVPPFRASRELPHVTVAHEPDAILDFEEKATDLMLSGHTHGGQIRLPWIGALAKIPTLLGRSADRGRKIFKGIPLIISQGCAESDMRARLFCPAQIVVVEVGI